MSHSDPGAQIWNLEQQGIAGVWKGALGESLGAVAISVSNSWAFF